MFPTRHHQATGTGNLLDREVVVRGRRGKNAVPLPVFFEWVSYPYKIKEGCSDSLTPVTEYPNVYITSSSLTSLNYIIHRMLR